MVSFNIKSLVYQQLSPLAKAAGMQLLILDKASYKSQQDTLEAKMKTFGIEESEYRSLRDAIDEYGMAAVLKSKKYLGKPEVAPFFSNVGLTSDSIGHLTSTNAKNYPVWGDLDASIPKKKRAYLYWFPIEVVDADKKPLMEGRQ